VNLVLDQINLRKYLNDQEIIEDILGTLDASSNKYWTFSTEQTMLFVKDVLETNKYKGFTTATYFVSEDARGFLERLRMNRVIHGNITVADAFNALSLGTGKDGIAGYPLVSVYLTGKELKLAAEIDISV